MARNIMDDRSTNPQSKYSFPNSDQNIPGASNERNLNPYIPSPDEIRDAMERKRAEEQKPVVHIFDALRQEKQEEGGERRIRTYQADIADSIKNDNVSMIKIAMSEKNRQDQRGTLDQAIESRKISSFVLFGGIAVFFLLILIGVGVYLMLGIEKLTPLQIQNQQSMEPLIYTEDQVQISIDDRERDDIISLVKKGKDSDVEYGDTRRLSMTTGLGTSTRFITTAEFFGVLRARASDALIRSLDPNFLLGVYAFSPPDLFLIFRTNFYDGSFASMLEWEASIESDIGQMFINKVIPREVVQTTSPTAITDGTSTDATSTVDSVEYTDQNSPFFFSRNRFVDKVIQNKDSRALVDENGNVLMLYTFIDKETLVIASSESALKEVMFRVTTGRIIR